MLEWYKDETVECNTNTVNQIIPQLLAKYKAEVVLAPKLLDNSKPCLVEVWFNFKTGRHMVVASSKEINVNEN